MAKQTKAFKDARTTLRLDPVAYRKVDVLARSSKRTTAAMINVLMLEATGVRTTHPCILKTGDTYIWVSPAGVYGTIDKRTFRRFLGGGTPIEGDTWDDLYDNMEEACSTLGDEVCHWSYCGLVVKDPASFAELYDQYGRK